jgi:hypothetical protein
MSEVAPGTCYPCCTPEGQVKRYVDCIGCDRKPPSVAEHNTDGTVDMKKCEEIYVLIKLAKMTLTEINTLPDGERSILSQWFKESAEREQRIMKQYNLRNDYGQ